ncbi:VWA domain-containing protein [Paenibacillus sp. J14]|uniref:VWA domain-containing protein n=1 Tax=Paenibacillus sp. (strain J14) TaxID=935845 RepID=UPI0004B19E15|nr:VWA domain-containing protein [Paenibacillus sp. J14]
MQSEAYAYPFCAVVGQEQAKLALLLHAVNPTLRGVLLVGEPGTAKSTMIRGLAELLRDQRGMTIPLHVDEERLFGGIDTAAAIRFGERRVVPGLLREADGNWLTIHEVNLMRESILRAILSAAEQDGYDQAEGEQPSWVPSSFRLYGTMNPEEGSLPNALLDRWGLYVPVSTLTDPAERAEIVRRRLAFERDPSGFVHAFAAESQALRERLAQARAHLPAVRIGEPMQRLAAEIAAEAGCPGHRAELVLAELARTLAAWDGQSEVAAAHLREAAAFVLPHRMRAAGEDLPRDGAAGAERGPLDDGQAAESPPQPQPPAAPSRAPGGGGPSTAAAEGEAAAAATPEPAPLRDGPVHGSEAAGSGERRGQGAAAAAARAIVEAVGRDFEVRRLTFTPPRTGSHQAQAGKRNQAGEGSRAGRYIRAEALRGPVVDLALDATLRAAAPYQQARRQQASDRGEGRPRPSVLIEYSDLRVKVRESRTGTALLFVVDASGSMNAAKRMKAVKGAVLSLLRDAYRQRDSVGLVAFRDRGAELLLDITRSVELAERRLKSMPVGGKTPLVAGLEKGEATLQTLLRKGSGLVPAMIILTDGKVNVGAASGLNPWREIQSAGMRYAAYGIQTLVIDTEQGFVRLGYARKLAEALGAQYIRLEELEAGQIAQAVRKLAAGTKDIHRRFDMKR